MSFDYFDDDDELEDGDETQWVILDLDEKWFGVSIERVRELIMAPEIVELPDTPPFVLGLIKLRESTIPVIDLRKRLGMKSMDETYHELIDTLKARKQDHMNWIAELKLSVKENREFTKQTDPSKCEFGMWYDCFKTDDLVLGSLLKKFDAPHRAIHGIAVKVKRLREEGKAGQAETLIKDTENRDLKTMVNLFDAVIEELSHNRRQVILVADFDGFVCGMMVDRIESVLALSPDEIGPPPQVSTMKTSKKVVGVARPKSTDRMILLLDLQQIVDSEEIEILTEI